MRVKYRDALSPKDFISNGAIRILKPSTLGLNIEVFKEMKEQTKNLFIHYILKNNNLIFGINSDTIFLLGEDETTSVRWCIEDGLSSLLYWIF